MDVMQDMQKVRVVVDEYPFRPALEKGSNSFVPLIKIFRVADIEFHQKFRNAIVNNLGDEQVIVVAHHAPAMYVDDLFPFRCSTYEVEQYRFRRIGRQSSQSICRWNAVVEFIEIVNESSSILIIKENLPLIHTSI